MECIRCHNKDPVYFYKGHKGYYCRKCVRFKRILIEEELDSYNYPINEDAFEYSFNYKLTDRQLIASRDCASSLEYSDVLLHCVCGAGKTEIVVESISNYLKRGLKVAYAIARKEVVIELEKRFKMIFPKAKIVSVYGNHYDELTGDLIICTCHQLYRYHQTFDLLILDEVDAFPLKGNEALMNIALNSCKGKVIFSTATIDESLRNILSQRDYKTVELYVRPSFKPLVSPKMFYLPKLLSYVYLYILMKNISNQCIIFVSNRKDCEYLYRIYRKLFSCTYVYSDLDERDENIKSFREKKFQFIFSTTVLERGITINDVSIIILDYLKIFDEANFVQMLGRIGRGINSKYGEGYILTDTYDYRIRNTLRYIRKANSYL